MTDWIVIPNKTDRTGIFAFRPDQVITFHDMTPYAEDTDKKPRVRVYLANSTARTFQMSGKEFAALMGIPPEAYEEALETAPGASVNLALTPARPQHPVPPLTRDYVHLRARLQDLPFLENDTVTRKAAEAMAHRWASQPPPSGHTSRTALQDRLRGLPLQEFARQEVFNVVWKWARGE